MKKIFTIVLFCLVLCGCSTTYNLEIDGNRLKESINVKIDKSLIPPQYDNIEVESDNQITPFLENDTPVFFDNSDINYNKIIQETYEFYDVELSYIYDFNSFQNSNTLNTCFEDFEINLDDDYYIHALGNFYCAYTDETIINIKTKNKVLYNNADKVVGNTYTWIINSRNKNNVDIELKISKKSIYFDYLFYIVIAVLFVALIFFINYIKTERKNNNKI